MGKIWMVFIILLIFPVWILSQPVATNPGNTKLVDSLKAILPKADPSTRTTTLSKISIACRKINPDTCIHYARQVLKQSNVYQFWNDQLTAYDNLSFFLWDKKAYDSAFIMLDSAINISKRQHSDDDISYFETSTGVYCFQQGFYSRSLEHFGKSLEAMERTGNKKSIATGLNNISACNIRLGNYEKALDASLQSLKIREEIGTPKEIALALLNIGGIHTGLNNDAKTIEYYQSALKLFEETDDPLNQGKCLNNLGNMYKRMKDLVKAREYYTKAVKQYQRSGETSNQTSVLRNIAKIDQEEGRIAEALEKNLRSLRLCEESNDAFGKVNSKNGIGRSLMMQGDISGAIKYLKEAAQEAENIGAVETRMEAHQLMSECYEKSGNFSNALDEYKIFAQLTDTLLNQEKIKNINELQIRFETENKEKEIKILKQQTEIDQFRISRQLQQIKQQKSILFIAVLIILLVATILYLLFNRYRLKQINTREIAERHALQLESRLLRTQMNPHFLFNSLNSIQSYISEANTFLAETYLSKFASLLRNILEYSRSNLILLEKDIQTLELYLEIEQLRFKGAFDFEIIVEEPLLSDEYFIPPMIIQPFAENAILHGLRLKEGKGKLEISLRLNNDLIECEIIDDGIGRQRSMELNTKTKNKSSLGMQLTRERMEILKQQMNKRSEIRVFDLKDDSNRPTGTKVLLSLPFEQDL